MDKRESRKKASVPLAHRSLRSRWGWDDRSKKQDTKSNGHINGVTNGITNGHINGVTNGHTNNGYTNGYANGVNNGHINGVTNGHINGVTNGHTNGVTNGHTNGVTNGHINGVTNGHINGVTNGHINGVTNGHITNGVPMFLNGSATTSRSGGSALFKSMKYADTWLYSTVSGRGNNVSNAADTIFYCSCPEFSAGTIAARATLCRVCGGSRRPAPTAVSTVRVVNNRARPSLRDAAFAPADPYDLMRRSRMAPPTPRAKSSSPPRRNRPQRTPSPSSPPEEPPPANRAKSILECQVNPYDLIKYFNPNGRGIYSDGDESSDGLSDNALEEREPIPSFPRITLIPTPKRPPRRTRPLSADQARTSRATHPNRHEPRRARSQSLATPPAIKSILKKSDFENQSPCNSSSELMNSSTPPPPSPSPSPITRATPSPLSVALPPASLKKKQVQFSVGCDVDHPDPASPNESCESIADALTDSSDGGNVGKPPNEVTPPTLETCDLPKTTSLRRSLSDRLAPGAKPNFSAKPSVRPKKECAGASAGLFNDTMRLTLRVPRATSHGIFTESNTPKQRPKEPPPPPPPPSTTPSLPTVPPPPSTTPSLPAVPPPPSTTPSIPAVPPPRSTTPSVPAVPPPRSTTPSVPAVPPRQVFPSRRKSDIVNGTADKVEIVISDDWLLNRRNEKQRRHSSATQVLPFHQVKPDDSPVGTIVSISPHMTRVTEPISPVTKCDSPETFPNRKTSIFINSESNLRFKSPIPVSNKITISVGQPPPDPGDSSEVTCSSSPFTTSQTVIPITPDNYCSRVEIRAEQQSRISQEDDCIVIVKDTSSSNEGAPTSTINCPIEAPTDEINVLILDPVEAVKRNLVPHVCVRGSQDNPKISTEEIMSVTEIREVIDERIIDIPCVKDSSGLEDKPDESANNTYETITDPIYESISDTPPPLPLSPPPLSSSSRSIFEGASKADILSYLADARNRGIVPEETFVLEISSPDVSEFLEERSPVQHSRETSFDLADLSSQVSQISHTSESSDDSVNSTASPTAESPRDSFKTQPHRSTADVERNDSGVGSETSRTTRERWQNTTPDSETVNPECEDCENIVEVHQDDSGIMYGPLLCRKCSKRRLERREIISELVDTEEKFAGDLRILLDEFYEPMLVAGLLSPDQLSAIFLNAEELLEHATSLAERLRDSMELAQEQGDDDLLTMDIGRLFLSATPMLSAFEYYCSRQGAASLLLAGLEKEKELLRIFLRVSQMENVVLRRMNLNSFLMVPVQRVTKYPLLLARLYKVTPHHHPAKAVLLQAQQQIELHLAHMNAIAKDISSTKLWRRISIINGKRSGPEAETVDMKLRKVALQILEWTQDVRFPIEGRLLLAQPADSNWRRGRPFKMTAVSGVLVTSGGPSTESPDAISSTSPLAQVPPPPSSTSSSGKEEDVMMFPRRLGLKAAALLLMKEKFGRYILIREPLFLDKCMVCREADWEGCFEIQELSSKDSFIFKAEDSERTLAWYRQLQSHAQGLGSWRKRRNALANIMINGMQLRS